MEAMSSEGPETEGDEEAPSDLNPTPVEMLQQTADEETNSGMSSPAPKFASFCFCLPHMLLFCRTSRCSSTLLNPG